MQIQSGKIRRIGAVVMIVAFQGNSQRLACCDNGEKALLSALTIRIYPPFIYNRRHFNKKQPTPSKTQQKQETNNS